MNEFLNRYYYEKHFWKLKTKKTNITLHTKTLMCSFDTE